MGTFEPAISYINQTLGPDTRIPSDLFAPGRSLTEAIELADEARGDAPGLAPDERAAAVAWVASLPGGIQEMIRALVHHNLSLAEPRAMTFAWVPGYDSELTVWEGPESEQRRSITVMLKTRYPGDEHPAAPAGSPSV